LLIIAGVGAIHAADRSAGVESGAGAPSFRMGRVVMREDAPTVSPGTVRLPGAKVVSTALPPVIDGRLDDLCWQSAEAITQFTQVEPREGALPTERTEVRLVYDRDVLYVAVHCFDREPGKIVATQLGQDSAVGADDTVSLVFDTYGRRREGYLFILNPIGAKLDALLGPGGTRTEWDAIWDGAGRILEDGWAAEFAIPFKSLSFGPVGTVWGFNVERVIRRKRESARWASPFKNKVVESLPDAGFLEGLTTLRKGVGLDLQPFMVGRYRERAGAGAGGFEFQPGIDIFYRVTPSLTAAVTVNTDFAETEVDERKVNLTRFPLFFPEKRDFFLQDAGIFNFGAGNAPLPFFSRRIGLGPSGEAVDIVAGGKVTGRVGDLNLGLMNAQVDSTTGVPGKNLSVARLSYGVFRESDVGAIFTYGDPTSDRNNYLVGADFNYRNTNFWRNNALSAHSWFMNTGSSGVSGPQMAFGAALVYPNEPIRFDLYASQIDKNFNPAMGFVKRVGIREYGGSVRYRWRPPGYVRTVDVEVSPYVVTNLQNTVETEFWTAPRLTIQNHPGDSLSAGFVYEREQLFAPFEINPGVVIPPGDYAFSRFSGSLSSALARPMNASATFSFGEFYDGTALQYGLGVEWRVSRHLSLGGGWEMNEIDLPAGSFTASVGSARLNIAFTPRLSWNTIAQYDNVSDTFGINSRIRWIVRPGSDVFLVFNKGFTVEDGRFRNLSTDVVAKLVWTIRF
jgi:hypothetical protein